MKHRPKRERRESVHARRVRELMQRIDLPLGVRLWLGPRLERSAAGGVLTPEEQVQIRKLYTAHQ